ncbi:MAG TPA: carboxypeptidase regulatory-like domain-containing protein, partial [Thermoanaerobaculia bacterium]|nr:carboxypeptidase regulatory-like domain-containing protein [Thermoanaerobaculia bacterium]
MSLRRPWLLVFLTLAAFCSGEADLPTSPEPLGTAVENATAASSGRRRPVGRPGGVSLTGHVIDSSSSTPVVGAVVKVGDASTSTDAGGAYSLRGLSTGTATLTVSRWGYETTTHEITLQSGSNALEVRLISMPRVQVTLTSGESYELIADSFKMGHAVFGSVDMRPEA